MREHATLYVILGIWTACTIGVVLVFWRASRVDTSIARQRSTDRQAACRRGDHVTTIRYEAGYLVEACLSCPCSTRIGRVWYGGSNRKRHPYRRRSS